MVQMKILSLVIFLLMVFVSPTFGANWIQTKNWNLQINQTFAASWAPNFEISSNGTFLALSFQREINVFNLENHSPTKVIKAGKGEGFIGKATFNPNLNRATELVITRTVGAHEDRKHFIDYYDVRNLNRIWSKNVGAQDVASFEFSPLGDWMISGGAYNFPIFNTETGEFLREIPTYGRSPYSSFNPSVSPDGSAIVTWAPLSDENRKGGVRVINANSSKEINQLLAPLGEPYFLKSGGIVHFIQNRVAEKREFRIFHYVDTSLKQVEEILLPKDVGKMGPATSTMALSSQGLQGDTYFASLFYWNSRDAYTASIYDLVSKQIIHLMDFPALDAGQEVFLTANASEQKVYVVTFQEGKKGFTVHLFERR